MSQTIDSLTPQETHFQDLQFTYTSCNSYICFITPRSTFLQIDSPYNVRLVTPKIIDSTHNHRFNPQYKGTSPVTKRFSLPDAPHLTWLTPQHQTLQHYTETCYLSQKLAQKTGTHSHGSHTLILRKHNPQHTFISQHADLPQSLQTSLIIPSIATQYSESL